MIGLMEPLAVEDALMSFSKWQGHLLACLEAAGEVLAPIWEPPILIGTLELEYIELHFMFVGPIDRNAKVNVSISAQLMSNFQIVSSSSHARICDLVHCNALVVYGAFSCRNTLFWQKLQFPKKRTISQHDIEFRTYSFRLFRGCCYADKLFS